MRDLGGGEKGRNVGISVYTFRADEIGRSVTRLHQTRIRKRRTDIDAAGWQLAAPRADGVLRD